MKGSLMIVICILFIIAMSCMNSEGIGSGGLRFGSRHGSIRTSSSGGSSRELTDTEKYVLGGVVVGGLLYVLLQKNN